MTRAEVSGMWITLNRNCNFRCLWCYAEGTHFDPKEKMPLSLAKNLVRLGSGLGIHNIIFLGGEPTLWPELPELVRYANGKGRSPNIVTNGVLFSRPDFLSKFDGLDFRVGLSLKAGNPSRHRALTGVDRFANVMAAIENLARKGISFAVTITVSRLVLRDLPEMIGAAVAHGASSVYLEFCTTAFDDAGNPVGEYMTEPREFAVELERMYEDLHSRSGGNLGIQVTLPFCLFSQEFLDRLRERKQLASSCHVLRREGLVFDPLGNLLMCNCLHHVKLGRFGKEFTTPAEFEAFWTRKEVVEANEDLAAYPSRDCIGCSQYQLCGGGCPLQWFVFDPEAVIAKGSVSVATGGKP